MKKVYFISFIIISLVACNNKYPDYVEQEEGVYMKLLSFDEGERKIKKKGFARVSVQIFDNEKLLYKRYKEDIIKLGDNEFDFLLKHLVLGDSASFMVPTKKIIETFKPVFLTKTNAEYLEVILKVYDYRTGLAYDKEMEEQLILQKYITDVGAKFYNGIYIKQQKKGAGKEIKKGDNITIAYEGRFINRLIFDKISGATAFTFSYGTQGQVIKGLEIAINSMREGEKSKIIIPSQLAFGEEGSTTGIVPPYTTVVYDLEIVKVN